MVDAARTQEEIRFETVEDYLDWAMTQPGRHELVNGIVVAMAPERVSHALFKGEAWRALSDAIERANLPCVAIPDGATVKTANDTAYEPDVIVQCAPLDRDGTIADAPIILVEVISESSRNTDTSRKLSGYFTIPTLMHYLILDTDKRLVIHHARAGEQIEIRFVTEGLLTLNPPGLTVAVSDMFASE